MSVRLSLSTLDKVPADVARPGYKREDVTPGILHIGVGNFHRAHQAVYLDQLFSKGLGLDWGIVGAGIKPFDAARRAGLEEQDWLTTVMELDPAGFSARVTGAMVDFCPVDAAILIERLTDPAIRIVSLTITEGGYFLDAAGHFDGEHPDIKHDAAHPDAPETVFGILLAGLKKRSALGHPLFTVLSCDNLPENGRIARQTTLGLAALISEDLSAWIADAVAFPNSMVDCITPATSPREVALVADRFSIADAAPVACEPFRQWVMEDNFPLGRPPLEHVGVEFVADVTPYETMKLRILNAGHAAVAYAGVQLGHTFVHDAMADDDIRLWLQGLMRREVIPVLPAIEGVDFEAYLQMCLTRFSNPEVGDTLARLCLDGSNRQPKFVLPTLTDALAVGSDLDGLALEIALWCRYCAATADPGFGVKLEDERADALAGAALATRSDPAAFLGIDSVFGDLASEARFVDAFARQMDLLWKHPARIVLRKYLET